jgi:hypothetical protein
MSNGGERWTFKLAEFGAVGDVGIPHHAVSLDAGLPADGAVPARGTERATVL